MTTERTHLSIGEVLSLLQPEFPDITISKIRFLESQGLLDPERTPSGYRKFHDDDIERLRWILTQQRDHFLPLKVIKDRLAAGDLGAGAPEGVLPLGETSSVGAPEPAAVAASPSGTPSAQAGTARRGGTEPARSATSPPPPAEPSTARQPTAPAHSSDNGTAGGAAAAAESPAEDHERAESVGRLVEAPEQAEPAEPAGAQPADAAPAGTDSDSDSAATDTETAPGGGHGKAGRRRHPTRHQPGEPTPALGAEDEPEAGPDTEPGPALLSLEDLSARSGLTPREIGELEKYGLIHPEHDGPDGGYDEEALVVARLAAGFNRFGIEPRHLRMYKVAAEREAGLFEQLISPLLKQRRPSARQQAVDMLEELAELADDLRAAMVRSALREYLGGS